MKKIIAVAIASMGISGYVHAAGFVNGGFEDGNTTGWDVYSSAYRGGVNNAGLTPAYVKANDNSGMRSAVIGAGYVDPHLGAALGSTVYGGSYGYRVEDTTWGGYASLIEQSVANYTDPNIFFAWKAVMLGAHSTTNAATMKITLTDDTTNTVVISREYNAATGGGGVDPRFSLSGGNYYTATWQIEQLTIDSSLSGHDFTLSVLAADCQPTGHWGYVYLDGFGAAPPTPGVPEPASLALAGLALAGVAASRRRKSA